MITIFCGPMFAGKSTHLAEAFRHAKHPMAFKPLADTRDAATEFVTHDGVSTPCVAVQTAGDILLLINSETDCVCIEEAQFFDHGIVEVCERLSAKGIQVYASCLDMDSNGLPFDRVGALLCVAESVVKLRARCSVCGNPASRTLRTTKVKDRVFVGSEESYKPVCASCWRSENDG